MNKKTKKIVYAAIIAALYVVLTMLASILGLSSNPIQLRFSEALNAMCLFVPTAVPGLAIGCLIANLLTGAAVYDVIFGSLATLIGAAGVYFLKKHKIPALLCPVVSNALIVPFVLKYAYGLPGSVWYFVLTVGIGQLISCTLLGYLLSKALEKYQNVFFK